MISIGIILLLINPSAAFLSPFPLTRSSPLVKITEISLAESNDAEDFTESERRAYDKIAERFLSETNNNETTDFPSAFPINPFKTSLGNTGGKDSLYSDEELFSVLKIHEELSEQTSSEDEEEQEETQTEDNSDAIGFGGIHDLVTKALENNNDDAIDEMAIPFPQKSVFIPFSSQIDKMEIDETLKKRTAKIRAIASDVDGTILTSKMSIHPRTRLAITRAIKSSSSSEKIDFFFPATGKSRKGALDSLGIEVGNLIEQNCAGVYLQGLFCVDTKGNVVYEKKLNQMAIDATETLVKESGISIVGYDGDNLYTTDQTEIVIHLHEHYGEPLPVLLNNANVGENGNNASTRTMKSLSSHEPSMHKLLLLDDDTDKMSNVVRPKLEALAEKYDASVTQALPTMLELLPKGCSKALGVEKLCEALGIDPSVELLAIGDAENDAGMLELASIGVCVGNASPPARVASDFVLDYTNNEGGAGFAMEWFGLDA